MSNDAYYDAVKVLCDKATDYYFEWYTLSFEDKNAVTNSRYASQIDSFCDVIYTMERFVRDKEKVIGIRLRRMTLRDKAKEIRLYPTN